MSEAKQDTFNYTWKPEEEFSISGVIFQELITLIRITLDTPEAQKIVNTVKLSVALEDVMKKSIETGKITVLKN